MWQALQEDEDENMEEGARIAIGMLGPDKQNLYPRIFQLVMADTAFTEGRLTFVLSLSHTQTHTCMLAPNVIFSPGIFYRQYELV